MNAPDRILMTVDAVGGVWNYALELARALGVHGVEFEVALMGPPPTASQRAEADSLPNVALHESTFALEWMDDPWRDVDRAGEWLMSLTHATCPDLIHLNGYAHAALPWERPVLIAAHSCVCSWFEAVQGKEAPPRYDEYRRRVRSGLAAADLVVAPTVAMLQAFERHYDFSARGLVIPNARDVARFVPAPKTSRIFAAGRAWDAAKNFSALNAVAVGVAWPIYLAGESADFANLRCLGKIDASAMQTYLAESAIYALPARYEPFGLSALEAGLSGCALVLGDIKSLREVWRDAAVFVDPDDHDALTEALNALIADDARRIEMGRRARSRALTYKPSKLAEAYLSAYRECLTPSLLETIA